MQAKCGCGAATPTGSWAYPPLRCPTPASLSASTSLMSPRCVGAVRPVFVQCLFVQLLFAQRLFAQRLFVHSLFIQSFSSNPIRLG